MRRVLIILSATAILHSCDIRDKDKQSIDAVVQEEVKPTTVQLIDSVYDFGTITEGENVEFSYRFKNTGTEPLIIQNAAASCGCTVPEKPEAPVKPGETGYIKVKFNSDKRPGQAHKSVVVTSNATPAFPDLIIKGNVLSKNNQ